MPTDLTPSTPAVFLANGQACASSLHIARDFDKRHDHVLRDIEGLLSFEHTPPGYFTETSHIEEQNGQTYRCFNISRDGFSLLAMGFTGPKALKFKLKYIEAFNLMEAERHIIANKKPKPAAIKPIPRITGSLINAATRAAEHALANLPNLGEASRQVIIGRYAALYGVTLPAPTVEEHTTTRELAKKYGMHESPFGKQVKHLKTPANGHRVLTEVTREKKTETPQPDGTIEITLTPYKVQVEQFKWNAEGVQAVDAYFAALRRDNGHIVQFIASDEDDADGMLH